MLFLLIVISIEACKYNDSAIWDKINSLDDRVTILEDKLTQMNSDISSISTIINALQNKNYVVSITEIEDGYQIEFSNGENVTIKDGKNDNAVPIISVNEFDGKYYWVKIIDGVKTWLTDENGNKLPVTGEDGITPIIKVSIEGYWLISYDCGITFNELLDEKGHPIKAIGTKGDSFFSDVKVEGNELVLILVDGTVLRVAIIQIEGLSSPVHEISDDYDITYQYNSDVIILNENAQTYIEKIEEDSILFFSSTTPTNILPDVGDIISAKVTEKTPYGLGNKVISKTKEGNMIKCVTSVASLDDIFKVLELKSSFSLTDLIEKKGSFQDEEGNYYEYTIENINDIISRPDSYWTQIPSRGIIGSKEVLVIPINRPTQNGAYAKASLIIGGILTYNKSKNDKTFECSLEPWFGIKGELGVTGKWVDGYILDLIKEIPVFKGFIQAGAVTLRPFLKLASILAVKGSGNMSISFAQCFSFKCGWTENGWFQQNTSPQFTLNDFFDSFSISGKVAIGPKGIFKLGCGLYTDNASISISAAPSLMFGAELGVSGKIDNNRWQIQGQSANLDATVDFIGNIKAKFFNINLYENKVELVEWNLLNLSSPIFPILENGSFNVTCTNTSPLLFDAQYKVTGGALTKLLNGMPSIRVDKDNVEVYHIIDDQEIDWMSSTTLYYQLTSLEQNTTYTAVPCIYIGDACYEWGGIDFSSEKKAESIIGRWGSYAGITPPDPSYTTSIYFMNILTFKTDGTYSYEHNPTKKILYWTDSSGESHSRLVYGYCSGTYVYNADQRILSLKADTVIHTLTDDGIEKTFTADRVLNDLFGKDGTYESWIDSEESYLRIRGGWSPYSSFFWIDNNIQ